MVFGANYFIVRPLFDQANPISEPPHGFLTFNRDTIVQDNVVQDTLARVIQDSVPHPHIDAINFTISD
jgi:hypothetical protein